jgi:hypothetical protein
MIFKHVLAHELYHCAEYRGTHDNPTTTQNEIAKWWFETGGECFANTVYLAPEPHTHARNYNPRDSLYVSKYRAAIFFQHLSNVGWPDREIHNWIMDQKFTNSPEEEAARISKAPRIDTTFPTFPSRFLDEKITFKNGGVIER